MVSGISPTLSGDAPNRARGRGINGPQRSIAVFVNRQTVVCASAGEAQAQEPAVFRDVIGMQDGLLSPALTQRGKCAPIYGAIQGKVSGSLCHGSAAQSDSVRRHETCSVDVYSRNTDLPPGGNEAAVQGALSCLLPWTPRSSHGVQG